MQRFPLVISVSLICILYQLFGAGEIPPKKETIPKRCIPKENMILLVSHRDARKPLKLKNSPS